LPLANIGIEGAAEPGVFSTSCIGNPDGGNPHRRGYKLAVETIQGETINAAKNRHPRKRGYDEFQRLAVVARPWSGLMATLGTVSQARFSVGELIHHRLFDYRGVIVDIDQNFQGTEQWYETVARSRPPRDQPWYHVLVDGSDRSTYVAERHLEADELLQPIAHPMLEHFFSGFEQDRYRRIERDN
jgi:heat shock protein HspQ